jgi:hypothetical protein
MKIHHELKFLIVSFFAIFFLRYFRHDDVRFGLIGPENMVVVDALCLNSDALHGAFATSSV